MSSAAATEALSDSVSPLHGNIHTVVAGINHGRRQPVPLVANHDAVLRTEGERPQPNGIRIQRGGIHPATGSTQPDYRGGKVIHAQNRQGKQCPHSGTDRARMVDVGAVPAEDRIRHPALRQCG